jgi:peptide/nickel transport system permease protein
MAERIEAEWETIVGRKPSAQAGVFLQTARTMLRNPLGTVGLLIILALTAVALAAPLLAPTDPLAMNKPDQFSPPSSRYLFGSDEFGRDILSRVIYGARISMGAGAAAVLIATAIGVPLGLLAGYFGGRVDTLIMRLLDCLLAFPAILLAMAIVGVLGPSSVNAMIAVAIVSIPAFSRLTRGSTLSQREKEYVEAARALDAGNGYIMFRTILPNCFAPIIVQMTVAAGYAVLLEAGLSFLGLGIKPPEASWGSMLNTGRAYLHRAPWYGIFPGLAITMLVLSLNFVADVLQQALDPTRRAL